MKSLISILTNPLSQFWSLVLLALIAIIFKRIRLARLLCVLATTWLLIITISPLPTYLIYRLERAYPMLTDLPRFSTDSSVYIMIMGGGHTNAQNLTPAAMLSEAATARLIEALRIGRKLQGSKLICSGYSSSGRITQAQLLAEAAIDLGWPVEDTFQMRTPKNTYEEIEGFKKRFGYKTPLIVVSSASHMPRVMQFCNHQGLESYAAPTDFMVRMDTLSKTFHFKPDERKLRMTERLMHEYAALIKMSLGLYGNP